MYKWMLGRMLVGDFIRDLKLGKDTWNGDEARDASRFFLDRISSIEARPSADQLSAIQMELASNSNFANLGWFERPSAKILKNVVLEDWLWAKRAVLVGHMRMRDFAKIEEELQAFVADRLKPQERESIRDAWIIKFASV